MLNEWETLTQAHLTLTYDLDIQTVITMFESWNITRIKALIQYLVSTGEN